MHLPARKSIKAMRTKFSVRVAALLVQYILRILPVVSAGVGIPDEFARALRLAAPVIFSAKNTRQLSRGKPVDGGLRPNIRTPRAPPSEQ